MIDAESRRRAATGFISQDQTSDALQERFRPTAWLRRIFGTDTGIAQDQAQSEAIATRVINNSLAGEPSVERRRHELGFEIITAATLPRPRI